MALFQKPPRTPEELEASKPLEIPPDKVLEMDEDEWYRRIYRGDNVPQLTVRAVLMGSFLGFFLAFTNLYVGLMTGWGLGVALTACILSYAIWNLLQNLRLARTPMTILENNCMQSTASSAGYATGNVMVSAIPALLMISATIENPRGEHLPWPVLAAWIFFIGALGTALAIPMKRNLVNKERLKFPSGTAAAATLQSLYSEGDMALKKARALLTALAAGAVFPILLDLKFRVLVEKLFNSDIARKVNETILPLHSPIFDYFLPARGSHEANGTMVANKPSDWTIVFDHNPVMIAAGAIVGLRIAVYMVIGGLVLAYGVGPEAYDYIWTKPSGEPLRAATAPGAAWRQIGLWLGVSILVSSSLVGFGLQWRTIVRAFRGLAGKSADAGSENFDLIQRTEVPMSWFAWGSALAGLGVVFMAQMYFGVPWYYGVLAVFMTFVLALVACRATGESDITPVGAMGKIMQLTYGVLIPQSSTANLMTASVSANGAGSAADLLNDLKSGYLLGANPRRQFMAQFLGIFTGTIATVLGFYIMVPDATALPGEFSTDPKYPAPAAQAWKGVADIFKFGLDNMHPMHQQAIVWGLILGAAMVLMETFAPGKLRKWMPSATGIGLGMILEFKYPLSMLIGALIAYLWTRQNEKHAETYLIPVAAGVIAGLSIVGVIVAVLNNLWLV